VAKRESENTYAGWLFWNEPALWRNLAHDQDHFGRVWRKSLFHQLTLAAARVLVVLRHPTDCHEDGLHGSCLWFWPIIYDVMDMEPEPELKLPLDIRCPTCGAAPGENCTLVLGDQRSAPHWDRRVVVEGY
jgi:hypothetical protein